MIKRSSKTISLQPVRCLEWQSLLLFTNIGQLCAKISSRKAQPVLVFFKEAVREQRQASEVAEARTSGPVKLVLYRQTGFSSASICLLVNRC